MTTLRTRIGKHEDLEKLFDKAIAELKEFFNILPKERKPLLILVEDRETINTIRGYTTERWNVGWIGNGNVYVLCPENYEKESDHKYSEQEYYSLMKHELCHLFCQNLCGTDRIKPLWIWEGLPIYASGQIDSRKAPSLFKNFTQYYDKHGKELYHESGFAVRLLIERYGKDRFLGFVKELKGYQSEKEFNAAFKEAYGFEPALEEFNRILNG